MAIAIPLSLFLLTLSIGFVMLILTTFFKGVVSILFGFISLIVWSIVSKLIVVNGVYTDMADTSTVVNSESLALLFTFFGIVSFALVIYRIAEIVNTMKKYKTVELELGDF